MNKNIFIGIWFALISFTFLNALNAQDENNSLEKIYTQTDRPLYFPDESIWFKSYIVDSKNTVSTKSEVMYAQLISPDGSVLKTIKLPIKQGYAYGDFYISENWVGGIYKLRTFTNWMRNFGSESFFTKDINIQKVVKPDLFLKLDFEKEGYGKSSTVIADIEAKDLKNNPLQTAVFFQVSIKGKAFLSERAKTNREGKALLKFQLPEDLSTRDVVLNVKVPYRDSFESISRSVPVVLDNIDLQFFPESGKMLFNTKNRIAFKAINEFGKPVDIEGEIFNSENEKVAEFSSFHDGMGSFELYAQAKHNFYAKITSPFNSEDRIYLPDGHKDGVNFRLKTDSLSTELSLFSTLNESLLLEVYNSNRNIYSQDIPPNQKHLDIKSVDFPVGITSFRISDKNGRPMAERLVFMNAHKQLNVDIEIDKDVYQTRDKVNLKIKTTDYNKKAIPANLSVAVVDNKILSVADDKQDHISSSLLLSTELKGKIHEPAFYFNPKEIKSYKALDYVMLTHGWRDYILKPIGLKEATYRPEKFEIVTGKVIDKYGVGTNAKLLLFDNHGKKVLDFETNDKGYYYFKQNSNQRLTLVAYREDKERVYIREADENKANQTTSGYNSSYDYKDEDNENLKFNNPIKQTIKKTVKSNMSVNLSADSNRLDEVVVTSYGYMMLNSASSITVYKNEINNSQSTAQLLQGRISGIQVVNEEPSTQNNTNISIRGLGSVSGNNQPLVILDGVPLDPNLMSRIDVNRIDNISILKNSTATALYGSSAVNGVIVITTKFGIHNYNKKSLNNAKYNNYAIKNYSSSKPNDFYYPKLFYTPKYDNSEEADIRQDFRQTIYWNPVVQTDHNGEAELEFFTSDAITSFKITTEGIGYNGLIGRREKTLANKKLLNLDFKLPNYCVLNDTINMPVTITNETTKNIQTQLNARLPQAFKLLGTDNQTVSVNANTSKYINLKIVPIKKVKDSKITISINSEQLKDKVEKTSSVISPYFPTEVSVSGSQSERYEFFIDNSVENSIRADFNIYLDIIGDVLDGIEGMMRQPYGCFEQVSSSTYPNILILKYLKETNKINKDIEEQALNYIISGYRKLVAYETSEDGFEWYGKTPPHETLTAYGLMQFTEMRDVFDGVDQDMIRRTIRFLLNQRDGKGGFIQKRGKYGFSGVRKSVNNAYIVYAMSEAGVKDELEKEYQSSLKEALKSGDSYRMALMALASYNFGHTDNFNQLISKLKNNIDKNSFENLPVQNTITNSYNKSKQIETSAFTLLALMKEKKRNEFLIANGIDYLVKNRKHGSFGSTQSTAMALKALIEYTKTQKSKLLSNPNFVEVSINKHVLDTDVELKERLDGKLVLTNIEDLILEGKNTISIKFLEDDKTFPYALNINYDSFLPRSTDEKFLNIETSISENTYQIGDNISMGIKITNLKDKALGMVTAVVGIPSGAGLQAWQLKKLTEEHQIAYYEIFDNYLVFYWRKFDLNETKTIRLDLKADIPGSYQAPASAVYPYYGDEYKTWTIGNKIIIK